MPQTYMRTWFGSMGVKRLDRRGTACCGVEVSSAEGRNRGLASGRANAGQVRNCARHLPRRPAALASTCVDARGPPLQSNQYSGPLRPLAIDARRKRCADALAHRSPVDASSLPTCLLWRLLCAASRCRSRRLVPPTSCAEVARLQSGRADRRRAAFAPTRTWPRSRKDRADAIPQGGAAHRRRPPGRSQAILAAADRRTIPSSPSRTTTWR